MKFVFGIFMWVVLVAGAVPSSWQRELECRLVWWHPRLMGIVSAFAEAFVGWGFLREVLFRHELNVLPTDRAIFLGVLGGYLLIEGLFRLGVTIKMQEDSVPSLPVAIVCWVITSIAKSIR